METGVAFLRKFYSLAKIKKVPLSRSFSKIILKNHGNRFLRLGLLRKGSEMLISAKKTEPQQSLKRSKKRMLLLKRSIL